MRRVSLGVFLTFVRTVLLTVLLTVLPTVWASTVLAEDSARTALRDVVAPFLRSHCLRCHGAENPEGDVRLDDLAAGDLARNVGRWLAVRQQIHHQLMPPEDEPQPRDADRRAVVAALTAATAVHAAPLPNQGNLIPHELLFGPSTPKFAPPAARLWRLSPEGYDAFVRTVHRGRREGIVQPFVLIPDRGIKDFSALYAIDEPTAEILLRNAEDIVDRQSQHTIVDGKVRAMHDTVREFTDLMDPTREPTRPQIEAAIKVQFRMAIGRDATPDEVAPYLSLYDKCRQSGGAISAVKTTLAAVLLKSDAMFRRELGDSAATPAPAIVRLSSHELASALSMAVQYGRDRDLTQASAKGELETREQIAAHVERLLQRPLDQSPRLMQFFREYFEYHRSPEVFKNAPDTFLYRPEVLVADTDFLVRHILERDRDVLRELLTTPLTFVNYSLAENKQTRKRDVPKRVIIPHPPNDKKPDRTTKHGIEHIYGLADDQWPEQQPVESPGRQRLGILMQPSWLASWSTNFDNDPVRRARWIRERLLGGTVPDLPIGVAAQVPDEPHRTFRERLQVTREDRCWKCHQKMDELGLPFEQFDHYGRFRTVEPVRDLEATEKNVDKKGQPLGPVLRDVALDTTGRIAESGDARLDGPVADPREFVRRLADSDRVRQVFVRHVFRFYLGRNETLSDAPTLQDADAAYVRSGGSFRALVSSLLQSDSFLYRRGSESIQTASRQQ